MGYLEYYYSEKPNFLMTLSDGATNQYPTAYIYNYDTTLKESVNLSHNADGQYIGASSLNYDVGNYSVIYKVFSNSTRTILNTDYLYSEDNLHIVYRSSGGVIQTPAASVKIDYKKIADEVWKSSKAKDLEKSIDIAEHTIQELKKKKESSENKETLSMLKDAEKSIQTLKENVNEIKISLVKEIKNLPKPIKPEKVDLAPVMDKLSETTESVKEKIESIDFSETNNLIREKIDSYFKEYDYGATLNELIKKIELLESQDYGATLSQMIGYIDELRRDIKKLK